MALFGAMALLGLTWLWATAVVLGLGVSAWRLLGLETGATARSDRLGHEPAVHLGDGPGEWRAVPAAVLRSGAGRLDDAAVFPSASVAARAWRAWWLGLAALLGLLQAWHLVLPVDGWCGAATTLLGAAGCWWCRAELAAAWREVTAWITARRGVAVGLMVAALWVLNRAAGWPGSASSAGVWLPLVSWTATYPAVPGVGNVDPTLGYAGAWTPVLAWLSAGPIGFGVGVNGAGAAGAGWLWWWLSLAAAWGLVTLWESRSSVRSGETGRQRAGNTAADLLAVEPGAMHSDPLPRSHEQRATRQCSPLAVYHAALGAAIVVLAVGASAVEPWASSASAALLWVAVGCALGAAGPEQPHRGRRIDLLATAALLSVAAVAADPWCWPASASLLAVVLYRLLGTECAWIEGRRPTFSLGVGHETLPGLVPRSGTVAALVLIGASLVLLVLARATVTTGYPLFPWKGVRLPVDWALPTGVAWSWSAVSPRASGEALAVGALGAVLLPGVLGVLGLLAWVVRGGAEGKWKHAAALGGVLAFGLIGWAAVSGRGLAGVGPAWALAALTLALNTRTIAQRGRPVEGMPPRALVGVLTTAALALGAIHVAAGAGRALWPVRVPVATASGEPLANGRALVSDVGEAGTWRGVPLRWPWSSASGLMPDTEPRTRPWVSRWGVTVALTGPGEEVAPRDEALTQTPSAEPRNTGVSWLQTDSETNAAGQTETQGGSTESSAYTFDAPSEPLTWRAAAAWPWAQTPPRVFRVPSVHLRYRAGGEESGADPTRHGFFIDRRGAANERRPGSPYERRIRVPLAERGR